MNEGWLDIATAPKDGTEILIATISYHGGVIQASWWPDADVWQGLDGEAYFNATHWQPLPKAPVAK